jgi:hypothetical protein
MSALPAAFAGIGHVVGAEPVSMRFQARPFPDVPPLRFTSGVATGHAHDHRSPPGDPTTLGNMRANGVRPLAVPCWQCHHRAFLSAGAAGAPQPASGSRRAPKNVRRQTIFEDIGMTDSQQPFITRYPGFGRTLGYIRKNPHMGLSVVLFCVGTVATVYQIATLAGALFGAGAALLGAWITELNNRRSAAEEKSRRQSEARQYLAPELYRTIERALYIHERAIPNFSSASAENQIKPNDRKDDFIPYWPVLYPTAPQFRDLPGDKAAALITFYDSLHSLAKFVEDWWEREGQLSENIFNAILHNADKSLRFALICIKEFDLEQMYPPQYESSSTISSRIERSLSSAEEARKHHIARAKSSNKATPPRHNS